MSQIHVEYSIFDRLRNKI